jgi:hypothetical protein
MTPQIAQGSRTKQGIADSMEQDVSIRVTLQATIMWNIHTTDN